jgi:hypothetical protein
MDSHTHRHVNGNDRKPYERKCIPPLGALWSITEGKKVTHDEEAEVEIIEDKVDNTDSSDVEALVLHCVRQDVLQSPVSRSFFLPARKTGNNLRKRRNSSRVKTMKGSS